MAQQKAWERWRTRVGMKQGGSHHRDQKCPWRIPFTPNQSFQCFLWRANSLLSMEAYSILVFTLKPVKVSWRCLFSVVEFDHPIAEPGKPHAITHVSAFSKYFSVGNEAHINRMEDGLGQEQSRGTLSSYVDFLSALAQIGFSVVWSRKKTEKPDANALCWSPSLVIQASAQVLQILTKQHRMQNQRFLGQGHSLFLLRCVVSRELK